MFAVVDDLEHTAVFVKQGVVGFWPCQTDRQVAWAHMHVAQGPAVTEAALRGSMVGWNNPAAQPAVQWEGLGSAHTPTQESHLPREILKRALSIRQPLSELILRGKKPEEYRSRLTHIRGRVYLYAGKKLAQVDDFPEEEATLLPRGVILGSIEIVGCHWDKKKDCYAWELADPIRYSDPLVPHGVPQPGFWHPKF
jgi:ASCH domain